MKNRIILDDLFALRRRSSQFFLERKKNSRMTRNILWSLNTSHPRRAKLGFLSLAMLGHLGHARVTGLFFNFFNFFFFQLHLSRGFTDFFAGYFFLLDGLCGPSIKSCSEDETSSEGHERIGNKINDQPEAYWFFYGF